MKNYISLFITFASFLIICIGFNQLFAQSDQNHYQKVTYYHVDRDGLESFTNTIQEWKQSHQDLIDNSNRVAWRLYRVPFSSGGSTWYNFVTVEIAAGLNALQSSEWTSLQSLQTSIDHQMIISYAAHSEIWVTEEKVYRDEEPPSRYMNANFMYAQPHSLNEYLELESDIAKDLHQNQVDNNRMDGWNFNRLLFPTGSTVAYNFITTDFYSDLEQIEMGITRDIIMEVHPDMDVDEFEDFADSIRERVWSDLWEMVEYAD